VRQVRVAVVGGGPAGLAAATAAADAGARVGLFEENPTPGGQLRYRIAEQPGVGERPLRAPALAEGLVADARAAGVDLRTGAVAWGLFAGNVLGVVERGVAYHLEAERIVLATRSTDLPFPFPGGSLPGVLTGRALQILLHVHRVLPGQRFAVVGTGWEAREVAVDVELAGGTVVAWIDPAADAIVARGDRGVSRLWVGADERDVDAVVVAVGRQPDVELALMAGCDAGYFAALGGLVPLRDDDLRSSVHGLFIAGDAAGVCDVATAVAEGRFAGRSAAASLGLVERGALDEARRDHLAAVGDRAGVAAVLSAAPTRV
jgi:sarcosine oxidase, subunit alpha